MTDDLLRQASRALREETDREDQAARFTRTRILASVHTQRRKRVTKAAFMIPLAAILVGSSAWAAASGQLPRVLNLAAQALGVAKSPELPAPAAPPQLSPRAGRAVQQASRSPSHPVAPPPTDPNPPVPSAVPSGPTLPPSAAASQAARPRASASQPTAPRPKAQLSESGAAAAASRPHTVAPSDGSDELYRAAHQAHFVNRDTAQALTAWDRYLASAPQGRFATEAAYNRAVCLVRLGRVSQAIAALEPFAQGRYGGYRQQAAQQLIDALRGDGTEDGGARPAPGSPRK